MEKYMICDDVDLKALNPKEVFWPTTASAAAVAAGAVPGLGKNSFPFGGLIAEVVAGVAVGAVRAAKELKDPSIRRITSIDELKEFKNGISGEWKKKTIYVKHPCFNNVLLEAGLYKDFILREMVADIADYISDHLDLSSLVIGIVASGKGSAKVKIPVQEINPGASLKCELDKNYLYSVFDTHAIAPEKTDYVWINQFPDVKSAVLHGAGKMEITKKASFDLDVKIGAEKANVAAKADKGQEFYISYVKKQ